MQDSAISTVGLAASMAGPSFIHLFLQADLFSKTVMILLLLASVWSWAVIIDKTFRLARLVGKANAFEKLFWSGAPLDDLYRQLAKRPDHPMALMFATAMDEWRESPKTTDVSFNRGLVGRIGQVMDLTKDREVEGLETNLSWLGTIASTAPFVGLLGTVWGIMNSFQAIAASKNTSLAVVAPGIAEALFATALGLDRGDPGGLVAYNKLSGSIGSYANRLDSFCDEFAASCRASSTQPRWPERMAVLGLGGERRSGRPQPPAASGRRWSEINVTPMVDVMLVLLIVFMVTAPLLTAGVPVDLPQADERRRSPGQDEPLTSRSTRDGGVFLQDTQMTLDQLVPRLQAITGRKAEARIFVRGDKGIDYGTVMAVVEHHQPRGLRQSGPAHRGTEPRPHRGDAVAMARSELCPRRGRG